MDKSRSREQRPLVEVGIWNPTYLFTLPCPPPPALGALQVPPSNPQALQAESEAPNPPFKGMGSNHFRWTVLIRTAAFLDHGYLALILPLRMEQMWRPERLGTF